MRRELLSGNRIRCIDLAQADPAQLEDLISTGKTKNPALCNSVMSG
jgi:hypothetical protein